MALKKQRETSGPVVRFAGAMLYAGCGATRMLEMIANNEFPKPFKISDSGKNIAFSRKELDEWLANRIKLRDAQAAEPKQKKQASA
jgi:predicted DNA-binding transcriptional regulator AlpA